MPDNSTASPSVFDATPRFLASELPLSPASDCRFHVLPVPYEASVSYGGGTAKGPAAILEASNQLEVWTGRANPSRLGIYTHPAVDCRGKAEEVLTRIEAAVAQALASGPQDADEAHPEPDCPAVSPLSPLSRCRSERTVPVILGGEHTVTLGVLRALKKRYGHFGVIQFDAHADLRDSYEGTPYSHACVMRRAVDDLGLDLFQVGVRALSPEEVRFRAQKNISCLDARLHAQKSRFPLSRRTTGIPSSFPERIFLSFDIDALDASLMPATGTPEPGGLFWWDALALVEDCLAGRSVLGFDLTELAPLAQMHAPTFTATRLVYEIMGIIAGDGPLE